MNTTIFEQSEKDPTEKTLRGLFLLGIGAETEPVTSYM